MRTGPSDLAPWNVWVYYPCRERGAWSTGTLALCWDDELVKKRTLLGVLVRAAAAEVEWRKTGSDWRYNTCICQQCQTGVSPSPDELERISRVEIESPQTESPIDQSCPHPGDRSGPAPGKFKFASLFLVLVFEWWWRQKQFIFHTSDTTHRDISFSSALVDRGVAGLLLLLLAVQLCSLSSIKP